VEAKFTWVRNPSSRGDSMLHRGATTVGSRAGRTHMTAAPQTSFAVLFCARVPESSSIRGVGRDRDGGDRSDEDLLAAWRAGDGNSGELLWRRHSRSVLRFFRNKVPWAVALDLAQRTVERFLRSEQPVRSFRGCLLGVAKHELFDYLRSELRRKRLDTGLETLVIEDVIESPEQWVSAKRERRVLLHALRCLPLPIQIVLELRYWERMSDREIAEVLEWPVGTVKTRILAGRSTLRREVERLTASPELLRSTLDTLEKWASRTHDCMVAAGDRTADLDGRSRTVLSGAEPPGHGRVP